VFSVWSVPKCYTQDKFVKRVSELIGERVSKLEDSWGSAVVSCCCEKLVAEA
jgi:hypothetical protein